MAFCAGEGQGVLRASGLRARTPYDSSPEEPGAPPGKICVGFIHSPGPAWALLLVQCQQAFAGYRWDRPSTLGVQAAVPSSFLLLSSRERFPALLMAATWPLGILR